MHDLKFIRENPEQFDREMARRKLSGQSSIVLEMDESRRTLQTDLQSLQQQRNEKSKEIGKVKSQGGDAQAIMDEVSALKSKMIDLEEQEKEIAQKLTDHLSRLPNIMFGDVPDGVDEDENIEVHVIGEVKVQEGPDHVAIGEALGLLDFETAASISGARFVILKGALARMERALAQFFLDTHTQDHGYTEVSPPLLVKDSAVYGTNQLPKFEEDLFKTTTGHWLIPTSEVPLTNMVANTIQDGADLPHRYTAFTPCFRSEAGSAGRDTRGMIRQHQFYKVEMVSITHPDESEAEHKRMLGCAETILKKLDLPFRTVVLCSGDTGFGAKKTYDLEVWLPGQKAYREISSCSNCGDFQARRMKARFRNMGEKDTQFLHTLNGSGVAVGRALVAVMENYYDPKDGGVFVPDVLKPYMGGIDKIVKA